MGYGYVRIATRPFVAHRVSWEIHNGPIRDGLWVLHRCDNPPCVNPDHLRLGTPGENNADCRAKGRHRGPVIEEGTR
ncbi:MAG TPA: HNH endonuclease signature motif containing protein [Chloroflexota bacterium]|nr:HNH endonuclease signature motif containing protein [Chloroflexota bacterium]